MKCSSVGKKDKLLINMLLPMPGTNSPPHVAMQIYIYVQVQAARPAEVEAIRTYSAAWRSCEQALVVEVHRQDMLAKPHGVYDDNIRS